MLKQSVRTNGLIRFDGGALFEGFLLEDVELAGGLLPKLAIGLLQGKLAFLRRALFFFGKGAKIGMKSTK